MPLSRRPPDPASDSEPDTQPASVYIDVDVTGDVWEEDETSESDGILESNASPAPPAPQFKVGDKIEFQHEDLNVGWFNGTVTQVVMQQGYFVYYMVKKNFRVPFLYRVSGRERVMFWLGVEVRGNLLFQNSGSWGGKCNSI